VIFFVLCACTLLLAGGKYRLDTSERRAETLGMVATTFLVINFGTAAWSMVTKGSPRTLMDIMSGTTVVTTRSMLPEHIDIRRKRHFGVPALFLMLVFVLFSTGGPLFLAQRVRTGELSMPEEEQMCIPALCLMGITNKQEWAGFEMSASETLKSKKIFGRLEHCTHKFLETTETVPSYNTFAEPQQVTTSIDIQGQCALKMSYKHEVHDIFESLIPLVRQWFGLPENTASHPERLMQTALQFFTDTDYDGSIDKEEFMMNIDKISKIAVCKAKTLGKTIGDAKSRLTQEFNGLDRNNDGAIDQTEFLSRRSTIADLMDDVRSGFTCPAK